MASFKLQQRLGGQLKEAVQGALGDVAKDYQRILDSLSRRYRGRPVSTIKPVLQREWKRVKRRQHRRPRADRGRHAHSNGTQIKMKIGK